MRLIFAKEFEDNFETFYRYLYSENPTFAIKWRGDFLDSLKRLKLFPNMGSLSEDLNKRKIFISPFWIFYTILNDETIFLNICYHSSQNFK